MFSRRSWRGWFLPDMDSSLSGEWPPSDGLHRQNLIPISGTCQFHCWCWPSKAFSLWPSKPIKSGGGKFRDLSKYFVRHREKKLVTPRIFRGINKRRTSHLFSNRLELATLCRTFKCARERGDRVASLVIACQVRCRSGEECLNKWAIADRHHAKDPRSCCVVRPCLYSDVKLALNLKFFKVQSSWFTPFYCFYEIGS